MKQTLAILRKELGSYFGSPMALIFIGFFLAATLFSFFWVETFFARGIADVRPLFRSMPVLLILLVGALTMRQWSEEQRSGTLEILLTLPVSYVQLVLGKFLAVVALVVIALALTLFLPLTVSTLGNLDWGPVIGGYLATVLLAAAYAGIGLFVSSRTDNQIVALISTVLVCGVFYLLGSSGIPQFLPDAPAEIVKALGTGSRFESIERGIIDLRDLTYYLALTAMFLTLNIASLDSKRWSAGDRTRSHRINVQATSALIVLNLLVLNVWIYPLRTLRIDLTESKEYSLSDTTRDLLANLQEPLLIRGYFSERTHPLLAPLVPRIRDMLREYEIAGRGMLELDLVDPSMDPEKESEANQVYGIRPTPFQVAGRYEASVINSYFHLLLRYGDQSVVLDYSDLIEVEALPDGTPEVRLRNLEYDLTRSIKRVVFGFQSVDAVLDAMSDPVQLTLYVTSTTLPPVLLEAVETVRAVVDDIQSTSPGKFRFELIDLDDPRASVSGEDLYERYGLQPIAVTLFSEERFYFYMVLELGERIQVLYPSSELTEADVRTNIEAALKRLSPGFLKVVGLWTPPEMPTQDMFGNVQNPLTTWQMIREQLSQDYEVRSVNLSTGQIPADLDVLVLIAPQDLNDLSIYAVDQYLMRGGAVVVAAGNFGIQLDQFSGGLGLRPLTGTLQEMLAHHGITVDDALVMDFRNEPFPVPVTRQMGNVVVQEIQLLDYPFFVDVRQDAMETESPIVANLQAVTLQWVSPLVIDEASNAERQWTVLLQSSEDAWLKLDTNIQPNFELFPELGFPPGPERQAYPLSVSVTGVFESFFKDQPVPEPESGGLTEGLEGAEASTPSTPTIESSPESARLVVIGSSEFLDDVILGLSSDVVGERYRNNLRLVQNAVDWSVEDLDLLNIRARGTQVRILKSMEQGEESLWEGANYAVALAALIAIGVYWNYRRRHEESILSLPVAASDERKQTGEKAAQDSNDSDK